MAGERKGVTYEAIISVVLNQLKKKGKLKGNIFWNETPKGMTIVPDLIVGKDIDHPSLIFLITHSGAAGNSHMKYWRNMGELAEAKIFLATIPRVFNIAFDSVIKESLKKIQEASFDGQLIVGDLAYGTEIQKWVDKNQKGLPKKAQDKADEIQARLNSDKQLKKLITSLENDLQKLIKKTRPELDQLWSMERKRKPGKAPTCKDTFVRRGLSKLLIFEDIDLALRLYRRKRVKLDEVPDYAYALGLAKKSIGRAVPGDPQILNAVELLTNSQIKVIVASAPLDRMAGWLLTLRNTPHLDFMGQYVINEFDDLCKPNDLYKRLMRLHSNPRALVKKKVTPVNWPPGTVWLLEYLIEFIKAASGSANGYGYAQLARDLADPSGAANSFGTETREYLLSPWGHLSEWVHRGKDKDLPKEVVAAICEVLSFRLSELDDPPTIVNAARSLVINNLIEAKLCTHRAFEPLLLLIKTVVPGATKSAFRTCFAEAAELTGQAGKTTISHTGCTIINWQSVSDAGRDHKKKELSGRAVGLRYSWNVSKKKFVARPGVKKLILVVDGTWRQSDLNTLIRAGWDEIYYPDQMDKLAKAIV